MKKRVMIVGSGFRGFCDALHLMKNPDLEIHIVDSAPFFGGVMHSLDINGFSVDKGVHIFDSIPVSLAETVTEIMDGKVHEIDFVSASAFNNKVTEGFSLPDLNSLDDTAIKKQIREELLALARNPATDAPATLEALFDQRYGKTAGRIFCDIFRKVYGISADEVEPTAIAQTSMGRLKFLDDPDMLDLKKDPFLDTVLAARRKAVGKVDDFVSIYPSDGDAMRGWCKRAVTWLESKGVRISLGTKISKITERADTVEVETDKGTFEVETLIWSNDSLRALGSALNIERDVDGLQYGTPMLFATLFTQADKVRDFTYLQNFDPDQLTYRSAASGRFSHQVREDGVSFVTCECPADVNGTYWNDTDKLAADVWDEIRSLGVVEKDAELAGFDVKRIPVSFKLARLGYAAAFRDFHTDVASRHKRVILRDVVPFFRRDIYLDSAHLTNLVA
ncbi:NAD(P)-binding protein [Roseobacter ponti]|uniref:NAD(P)-binding protein n=1 Tax=Roseobacter ponti TaxID=1891787 RepID=A0A858SYD5_9RHOB|nr:NAD(P)-binding protein [Roseobacter ponti]QJF52872.1 NAD(P)-binding protein [Roseobacter ponti]